MDVEQVRTVDLGRRMTGQRQRQIVRRDTAPIVRYTDQGFAAVRIIDGDPAGTGVNRVLDQFLDGGGRSLDDLPGGDPIDRRIVQLPNDGPNFAYVGVRLRHTARPSMCLVDSASQETSRSSRFGPANNTAKENGPP